MSGVIRVTGDASPQIGHGTIYTATMEIDDVVHLHEVKWGVYKMTDAGWVLAKGYTTTVIIIPPVIHFTELTALERMQPKKKQYATSQVSITFSNGLVNQHLLVSGYLHSPKLDIPTALKVKTRSSETPKISSIELLDSNRQPLGATKLHYTQTLIAKITTTGLTRQFIRVSLWEKETHVFCADSNKELWSNDGHQIQVIQPHGIVYQKITLDMSLYTKTGGLLQNLFGSGNDEKTYHLLAKASNVEMTSGNVTVVHEETVAHKPVVVRNGIAPNPVAFWTGGVAVVGGGDDNAAKSDCKCGETLNLAFKTTIYHGHSVHYGPEYKGSMPISLYKRWNELKKQNKSNDDIEKIINVMADNEGNMDSVQSWDNTAVTAGAMQNIIVQKDDQGIQGTGDLSDQLWEYKNNYPDDYSKYFEKCGWTVTKDGASAIMYYNGITGIELKKIVCKDFDENAFHKKLKQSSKPLETLVNAISNPTFLDQQVVSFINRLKKAISLHPVGYNFPISDITHSRLGQAVVLDQHINRPGYVKKDFGDALSVFFDKHPSVSKIPSEWGHDQDEYEKEIIENYGNNRRMASSKGVSVAPSRYTNLKARLK